MNSQRKVLADTANCSSKLPKLTPKLTKRKSSLNESEPGKKRRLEKPVYKVRTNVAPSSRIASSRNTLVYNPRRETMPARGNAIMNSTVAKPDKSVAAVRPTLSVSPIEASKQKLKKRPAWDLKGRIQDMEEQLKNKNTLERQLYAMTSRIDQLESQKEHLTGTVNEKEEFATNVSKEVEDLKRTLRTKEDEIFEMSTKFRREMDEITRRESTLSAQLNGKELEVIALQSSLAEQSAAHATIRADLEVAKLNFESAQKDIVSKGLHIDELKQTVQNLEAIIADNKQKILEHETVRRKLHNTILELKGNIRVFCRVRPLLTDEINSGQGVISHINFPDVDGKTVELESACSNTHNESLSTSVAEKSRRKLNFTFDKVFQPETTQSEVFNEISQLVQSALDGYNVCIFAYGQTGSGKTFTMEGGNVQDEETMGMIPRATIQVFETVELLVEKGWKYEFNVSFLEIYNETIHDLLSDKDEEKHDIKMAADKSSIITVSNLTIVPVTSRAQIHRLLLKASKKRAVGETKLNERSSRSHSVFTLALKGNNDLTGESCNGSLNLVDLAGSERLKDSGSEGKRLKETQCINKSLSTLSTVFTSLANKDNHIPYRNSKLTYLLQNSLGGNSKTLMFVNVSPKEDNYQETLNSLRFATVVNNCNIGTAQKKVK
ncbi:carboxy-terminal kinesin 2-like isoform X1 [Octopus vulgaris]|uniref:Kinesin-like protein n=1 Tax=Octopus vulgaris TaxID=6645 RepID=A0AA36B132_OCTVU|nr:carboxy-terminal kinesin 2-like isoform X1 [Octopus vulgaris]